MTAALLLLALSAEPTLASQVKAKLVDAPVITGTFEQSKQVKGFKRPLKSSGTYEVKKGEGVNWNTLKPFASELSVTAAQIRSTQGGAQVFALDAKTEPTVKVITTLLFSLLAGDLDALGTHFTAQGGVDGANWHIELTPKPGPLEKIFLRISLKGDGYVRSVHLQEQSGDSTLISLIPSPPRGEGQGEGPVGP